MPAHVIQLKLSVSSTQWSAHLKLLYHVNPAKLVTRLSLATQAEKPVKMAAV